MNQPPPSSSGRRLATLLMGLLALAGCDSSEEVNLGESLPELRIDRTPTADSLVPFGKIHRARNWETRAAAGQPYLTSYRWPRKFADLSVLPEPADHFVPVDHFAPARSLAAGSHRKFHTFQEIFEQIGVTFAEGTWALYDAERDIVTAYQTSDQHELIKAYLDSDPYDPEHGLHLHFEVFEVAAAEAPIILQAGGDSEKYQTLLSWLPSGRARLAGTASTPCRSGMVSESESIIEVTTTDPTRRVNSSKKVGLIMDFDAVRAVDNRSIDFRALLSTTSRFTDSSPASREDKLFSLPPPASFLTNLQLPLNTVHLLGLISPPSDIAATDPVTGSSADPVLFAFVRASDYAIQPIAAQKPESTFARESSNPFASRTHIYRIPRRQWSAIGEHLYGRGRAFIPVVFSNPELLDLVANRSSHVSLTAILSECGFKFSASSQLIYDAESETLIASLDAFEMSRLDLLFRDFLREGRESRDVTLQVEIFEIPARLSIPLGQSAALGADHTPEWKAVRRLVDDGDANAVTSLLSTSKAGQRGKFEDISERLFVRDYAPPIPDDNEDDGAKGGIETKQPATDPSPPKAYPQFETYSIGTAIEYDTTLTGDQFSIDVGIAFDHHTAPPEQIARTLQFPASEGGRVTEIKAPIFHRHRTITYTRMAPGSTRILAMWRPTGLPKYENEDLMQIAFLRATVLSGQQIERIR